MSTSALLGPGLTSVALSVPAREVVYVRALLEAHEGLAVMFAEVGGELVLATTDSQAGELAWFVEQLRAELGLAVVVRA